MLGKNVSDVRLTELGAPRNETVGTEGFGSALAAARGIGAIADDKKKNKAAVANGELINEFLTQDVEAALETEGFKELDDRAKHEVTLGVGEFDRYLTQVVEQKGGNAFTKAQILRTRKAMEAISANPANAEAVIKAAGLADKVGAPLQAKLKEEESARRELKAEAAEFHRETARQSGIEVPQNILLDDDAMLGFVETSQEFSAVREIKQYQTIADGNGARRDANEIERNIGISIGVDEIGNSILSTALEIGQGGSNSAQGLLALEQSVSAKMTELQAKYPYMSNAERVSARAQLDSQMTTAKDFVSGKFKGDLLDLYQRNLGIQQKKLTLARGRFAFGLEKKYGAAEAEIGFRQKQAGLHETTLKVVQATASVREQSGSNPYYQNLFSKDPELAARFENTASSLADGSQETIARTLLELGTPQEQALAVGNYVSNFSNPQWRETIPTEALGHLSAWSSRVFPQLKETNPDRHREMVSTMVDSLTQDPGSNDFFRANAQHLAPLAKEITGELSQRIQSSLFDVVDDNSTAFNRNGSAEFNAAGSRNIAAAFSDTVLFALSTPGNLFVKHTQGDNDKGNAADQALADRAAALQSSLEVLGRNPTQQSFYSNVGSLMQLDAKSINSGVVRFELSNDAQELIADAGFKADLQVQIDRINATSSDKISRGLQAVTAANGYPSHGVAWDRVTGGNLSLNSLTGGR